MASPITSEESSTTPTLRVNGNVAASPVDNTGKRAELRTIMLKKLRPYPLRHEWAFWHERYCADDNGEAWEDQLKQVAEISTVQSFWQVFNNAPFASLPLRDSYHLFKKGIKPIWEDRRNKDGGAWTFRVPKASSYDFWKEILMMAIGEVLQEEVEKGDDICGVSISVRFNSHLIMVWNRNGSNQTSIDAIMKKALENLTPELQPQQQNIYYKKHSAHKSFKGETGIDTSMPASAAPKVDIM